MSAAKEHTLTLANGAKATIYKQKPGADIDPGWWAVISPVWWDAGRPLWLGPYPTSTAAKQAARRVS